MHSSSISYHPRKIRIRVVLTLYSLYLVHCRYNHYKQRLEKLVEMMLLLTEVANLGNAFSNCDPEKLNNSDSDASIRSGLMRKSSEKSLTLQDKINRSSTMINGVLKTDDPITSYSDSECEEEKTESVINKNSSDENTSTLSMGDKHQPSRSLDDDDEDGHHRTNTGEISNLTELLMDDVEPPIPSVLEPVSKLRQNLSTNARITALLDGWEEPVNKADKIQV